MMSRIRTITTLAHKYFTKQNTGVSLLVDYIELLAKTQKLFTVFSNNINNIPQQEMP